MSIEIQEHIATRYPIFGNFLGAIWNQTFDNHYDTDEDGFRAYLEIVPRKVRYQFRKEVERISKDKLLLRHFDLCEDGIEITARSFEKTDLFNLLSYLQNNLL